MRRTFDRSRDARGKPSSITPRLITMIAMLGVLIMLIYRARDPDSWRWLTKDGEHAEQVEDGTKGLTPERETPIPEKAVTAPREPVSRGPIDTDVEELAAALEESQAISDNTIVLQSEEMPVYWRLFSWVDRQSFSMLEDRSSKGVAFNEFMQRPDISRRRIVQIDLNVRRVLRYEAPENPARIKQVYEIWGWTDESQAWPYVVVTPYLPPGMPVGASVYERATFAGYFFKLQGYHAAGAAPNDKPLSAPLFVGRLSWHPSATQVAPQQGEQDYSWIWWVGLIGLAYGGIRLGLWWRSRAKPAVQKLPPRDEAAANRLEEYFKSEEPDPYDFPPAKEELLDDYEDPEEKPDPFFRRRNGNYDGRGEL